MKSKDYYKGQIDMYNRLSNRIQNTKDLIEVLIELNRIGRELVEVYKKYSK